MATPTFREFMSSPQEQWGEDGSFRGKRRLRCAWEDRYTLLDYVAEGAGRYYPYFKNTNIPAIGATIIPFDDNMAAGDTPDMMSYGDAVVTVTYALQPYNPQAINNFMVVEELNPWREYITLPAEKLHVGSAGGGHPSRDVRVMHGGLEYTITFFDLIAAPASGLDMLYSTNSALWATYLLGLYFNPTRLLLTNVSPWKQVRLGLRNRTRLTYQMLYRAVPWTQALTENGWQEIYNDDGDLVVSSNDFNLLRP